ncbi:hypothetical protein ZTR_09394 [Talaromyces verruculosus]|nr:hypothetical protein ZTR_09394 [Talaromyces verruculosus]
MSACRALEADIVSEFSFGEAIGAIDAWHDKKELDIVSTNDEIATWMPLLNNFPRLFSALSSLRCILQTTTGCQIPDSRHLQDFRNWAEKACRSALLEKTSYNHNLIHKLTRSGLPPKTSLSEAKENLGPGTDTTSATLAHIIWALSHNIQFQERLFQDLQNNNFSSAISDLEAVPRLRACVKEGIRWTGAAAVMLPRLVPQGGIELHGKFIPEGVILSSSPIWYLRDAIAFPNPKDFDPYRWLTPDGLEISQNQLRDKFYIPFSKGGNSCIGAHDLSCIQDPVEPTHSFRYDSSLMSCSPHGSVGGCDYSILLGARQYYPSLLIAAHFTTPLIPYYCGYILLRLSRFATWTLNAPLTTVQAVSIYYESIPAEGRRPALPAHRRLQNRVAQQRFRGEKSRIRSTGKELKSQITNLWKTLEEENNKADCSTIPASRGIDPSTLPHSHPGHLNLIHQIDYSLGDLFSANPNDTGIPLFPANIPVPSGSSIDNTITHKEPQQNTNASSNWYTPSISLPLPTVSSVGNLSAATLPPTNHPNLAALFGGSVDENQTMQWPPNIPEYLEPLSPPPSNSSSSPVVSVAAIVPPSSNVSSASQHTSYPHSSHALSSSFVTYQHNPSLLLLHVTTRSCKQAVIRVLLRRDAAMGDERDGEGLTAPHIAAELGDGVIVDLLLDHGADPRVQDSHGRDALYFAVERGHCQVVEMLLDNTARDLARVVGNRGQGNYAAANAFLDSFAAFRRSRGQAACSVDLGVIEDAGVMAESEKLQNLFDTRVFSGINSGLLAKILYVSILQQHGHPRSSAATNAQLITGLVCPQPKDSQLNQCARFSTLFTGKAGAGEDGAAASGKNAEVPLALLLLRNKSVDMTARLQAMVGAINSAFVRRVQLSEPMDPEPSVVCLRH